MSLRKIGFIRLILLLVVYINSTKSERAWSQQARQPFTVRDEIGLTLFGDQRQEMHFSPDGKYFAVWTERGRLDLNRPEDSLRFYRSQDIENFLDSSEEAQPSPVWVVNSSAAKEGPLINAWRWLADSSGVAFLERIADGNLRLVVADIRRKSIQPLTSTTETVGAFDVHDRRNYVYTVADTAERRKVEAEHQVPAIVGTGHGIEELILADDSRIAGWSSPRHYLWAVVGGKRFEVKRDGAPFVPEGDLALSPDGGALVTTLPVPEVPASWEILYPPPFASYPYRIRVGRGSAHQYVRIDLETGSVETLTDAPTSNDAGWWALGGPSWSGDGQEILLPGTFISSKDQMPSRPCVAVVDLPSRNRTCVEVLKGHTETGVEEGYHLIDNARFPNGDKQRVLVSFHDHEDFSSIGTTEYQHTVAGTWRVEQVETLPEVGRTPLGVIVKQAFNEPPLLIGTYKQISRVIWDPNPQLKNIDLMPASVYKWKDKEGRSWRGGLFKPRDYKSGRRYPLVIQTHGFEESRFIPSGIYPTAFAARALAAAGIVVLQVQDLGCMTVTTTEGPCAVSGYEAAVDQLVSEGLADPERIGIIGFSRTCFYVMETLTTGSIRLKAASITDGVLADYSQYILFTDRFAPEANSMIGAQPFGEGLQQWLKRSPGYNLDKISAPLLVVGEGPVSLLLMWQPYAGLHLLQKPVDLIMLNTDEHVLTNPAVRLASQGGTVDWFRFWLQDYEDPDPAKVDQYQRWHGLRKQQAKNEKKSNAPQSGSN